MPLDQNKLALVHIAKNRLAMADDDYRALLRRVAGVDSARFLDGRGFNAAMTEFERLGFKSDFGQANMANRPGMATPRDVALIKGLWRTWAGRADGEAGLRTWLESHWGVGHLRFVTDDQARRIIGALQVMVKKRKANRDAPQPDHPGGHGAA